MAEGGGTVLHLPPVDRPTVTVTLWEDRRRPSEADLRDRLAAEGYQTLKWSSAPHQRYLAHAHVYAELLWVITGSYTVVLPSQQRLIELNPGDRIELPGLMHASQAGPDGATYLAATR